MTDAIAAALALAQHLASLTVEAFALLRRAPALTVEEVQREIGAIRASAVGASAADWRELQEALRKVPTPGERP